MSSFPFSWKQNWSLDLRSEYHNILLLQLLISKSSCIVFYNPFICNLIETFQEDFYNLSNKVLSIYEDVQQNNVLFIDFSAWNDALAVIHTLVPWDTDGPGKSRAANREMSETDCLMWEFNPWNKAH
jgi:hypothetical protein